MLKGVTEKNDPGHSGDRGWGREKSQSRPLITGRVRGFRFVLLSFLRSMDFVVVVTYVHFMTCFETVSFLRFILSS